MFTVRQDLTSDGSEFQVCEAATEKDRRANSSFLGRLAAGRQMTAEDELEQLSGSGHSGTLALRKTSS